ncbi:MAG: flavodoxin family protein [Bacteroidales bacterium]|nr:flavodoxin family protein [Bacteroidales bacterium]
MKKIVVLNGSPRLEGNTVQMIREFRRGAEEAGAEVAVFDLKRMDIKTCLGCCRGGKNPDSPCVQRDDMERIYPAYEQANVLVLASPMYYWSVTAILKAAFDRLFAVAEKNPNLRNPRKDAVLLMASEGDTEANFKPVSDYYHALLSHLRWNNLGEVNCGGVMDVGDISNHPKLADCYRLGLSVGKE